MKKFLLSLAGAAIALCPFIVQADLPAMAVSPRVYTLLSGQVLSNQTVTVNVPTNVILTASYTHGLPVETVVYSTNSVSASSVTNYFDLSIDGSNFTTTASLTTVATITGATTNRSITIVPATSYDGCKTIQLSKVGTGAASNVVVSVRIAPTP